MRKKIAAVDDIIERFGGKIEDIDLTQRDTARQTVFLRSPETESRGRSRGNDR